MTTQLAIITPLGEAPTLLPTSGKLILGSSSARADIVFSSQGVADVHCVIAKTKDGGWAIQDMGSEFGTMIDGKAVEIARLVPGQTILIASVSIQVIATDEAKAPGVATPPKKPEASAKPAPSEATTPTQPSPPPPKKSQSDILDIPGYSIQETLGKGGMGAVFRARQERLNRDVALKVLSPRLAADAEFVRRFHKEAQAVAALNHPNIVTVYDVGEAGGTHYIAMEYMDDNSLEELLAKEGRLPWKRVAEMLLGAARGLTYAESRRIVHRDIKPSNLMLNSDDQVKISDLGLAQKDNEDTSDGRIFGTPHFIAPEQIRGSAVDRRCDIYSLGATGYQLLTGYTPFEGVNSREILRAVLTEDFEPIDTHLSGTPRALSELIEKMIARDPETRPQSAESVVAHLQNILSGSKAPLGAAAAESEPRGGLSKLATIGLALAAIGTATWYVLSKGEQGSVEPMGTPAQEIPNTAQVEKNPLGQGPSVPTETPKDTEPEAVLVTTTATTPIEDDAAQDNFEDRAELEFLRLEASDLTLEERLVKLQELAEKYNGTTAAAKALAQAQINAALIKEETEAALSLLSTRKQVIAAMTEAAALSASPALPAKALAAIQAVPGQDALAADEEFSKARALLRDQVCAKALTECSAIFEEAKLNLTNPDQQLAKRALESLVSRLQFRDMSGRATPTGFEDLRRLEADARALLSDLDGQRELANASLAFEDGAAIANYCYSQNADGLRAHLRELRLGTAVAKLRTLEATIRSHERKAHLSTLAADLAAASDVFETLIGRFGEWKRRTVTDPRPRRSSAEALSVNAEGLTLKSSNGGEFISWSSFTANPEALNKLFYKRLDRDWTAAESRGIGLLINFAATLNASEEAAEAFDSAHALKPKDVENLLEALAISEKWAEGDESIERNRAAVTALLASLELAATAQWAAAESSLHHTSTEYSGTLLILLLSDGTPQHDPPAAPPAEEAPEGLPAIPDSPSLPKLPEDG